MYHLIIGGPLNRSGFYCDNKRHLVCVPYSKGRLHEMADMLNIKGCWFHKDHYDIPKLRIDEIKAKCTIVSSKEIVNIIKTEETQPTLFS